MLLLLKIETGPVNARVRIKPVDFELLSELVKDAKNSDRQIAKKLGISQPTVTRKRARLERELSLVYTAIPDWSKLGYEIIALTFSKWKHSIFSDERVAEAKKVLERHPNIIFVSTGQGMTQTESAFHSIKAIETTTGSCKNSGKAGENTWKTLTPSSSALVQTISSDHLLFVI